MIRAAVISLALTAPASAFELSLTGSVTLQEAVPAATHRLATSPLVDGVLETFQQEGPRTTVVVESPNLPSTVTLAASLREQLAGEGFDILLACATEACGGYDFRFEIEVLPAPTMFVNLADYHYLSFARDDAAGSLVVSRSGTTGYVQMIMMGGPEVVDTAVAKSTRAVATGPLADILKAEGRAVLEDVAFETGSDSLADPNADSLSALADILAADDTLRVALVGHTDAVGALDANIALSKRRASAVRDALVDTFGVASEQVVAEGIGFLAPRTTNVSDEGRAQNRRVEVVITSTR